MLKNKSLLACCFVIAVLAGCDQSNKAEQLASQFWLAIEAEDFNLASSLTLKSDPTVIQVSLFHLKDLKHNFISSKRIQNRVLMTTELVGNEEPIYLVTVIKKSEDSWRIDFEATRKSMSDSLSNNLNFGIDKGKSWLEEKAQDLKELVPELPSLSRDSGEAEDSI